MPLSTYRQKLIEKLIARDGGRCCYCKVAVRRNWMDETRRSHDATVDHIVPKSQNGPNNMSNYALACRACNQAKGDLSVEQFVASHGQGRKRKAPRAPRPIQPIDFDRLRVAVEKTCKVDKPMRGTLAWAAERSEVPLSLPRGATLPPEPSSVAAYAHSAYAPPRKLSGLELARLLRQQHGPWPLA